MKKKTKPNRVLSLATRAMELPEGAILGLVHVELEHNRVLISEHRGIIEYGQSRVCIAAKAMTIEVTGSNLYIVAMSERYLRIKGIIESVKLLREGE